MARFTDVFEDVTKQGTKIPTNRYLEKGAYPIIDQGQSQIADTRTKLMAYLQMYQQ